MPNPLDYSATLPSEMFNEGRAPFVVQVGIGSDGKPNMPTPSRFRDYIPKNPQPQTKASDHVTRRDIMRAPITRYKEDYISGADAEATRQTEKTKILDIAKQLWADEQNKRALVARAEAILAKPSKYSEEDVDKAKRILERTKPMTKALCMQKAATQFYGLRS